MTSLQENINRPSALHDPQRERVSRSASAV